MTALPAIEDFLQDIPGSKLEGTSLRYEDTYDAIREAQRSDDDLPQGVWVQDLKLSDWSQVASLCEEALKTKSKDIQIAAWLMEAWIFIHGVEGAHHGLQLLERLSEKYWDGLYPQIEEDGDKGFRFSPYVWVNEKLAERVKFVEVTHPSAGGDFLPVNFAQYISIKMYWGVDKAANATIPDEYADLLNSFEKGLDKTSAEFLSTLKAQCESVSQASLSLEKFLESKGEGEDSPSLYRFRSVVEEIMAFSDQALSWKGPRAPKSEPAAEESQAAPQMPTGMPVAMPEFPEGRIDLSSLIRSREEAYDVIRQAADYLERLDPHSPAPHMIKRAAAWGNLPLKDLLSEVIQEPQALAEVKNLLGLEKQQSQQAPKPSAPKQPAPQTPPAAPATPLSADGLPQSWVDPAYQEDKDEF